MAFPSDIEIARAATENGIETVAAFFSLSLAKELRKKYGPSAFITSHNACAHIDCLDDVMRGVAHWLFLAFIPSSLLLGVTTYLTTDIAAVPLFWIVPLSLYLLSFILVFARWPVPWTGTPKSSATCAMYCSAVPPRFGQVPW